MTSPRAVPLALLLMFLPAAALAGCLGDEPLDTGAAGDGDGPTSRAAPRVDADHGAIQGVVTDTAVQPLVLVTVEVLELERSTTTRSDGSFHLSKVLPGAYTLRVAKPGYVPATTDLTVQAGQVAVADFVLVPLVTEQPYVQTLELGGFMACGAAAGFNLSMLPAPPEGVPDVRGFSVAWTMCEDVEYNLGNTTGDATYWTWAMEAPLSTFVYEIDWDPQGNELASKMWSRVNVQDWGREITAGPYTLADVSGAAPLHARVDRHQLASLQANFTELCEGGDDAYCGHNFFDSGWPLAATVLPNWDCASDVASACAVAEQRFTVFSTGFYHAPAPVGWSVLDETSTS